MTQNFEIPQSPANQQQNQKFEKYLQNDKDKKSLIFKNQRNKYKITDLKKAANWVKNQGLQ